MDARVRCEGCDFAWYGADSAHGLSVLGRCPRCGAALEFLEPAQSSQQPSRFKRPAPDPSEPEPSAPEPSRILGVPRSWD
jgi:hypothetical protein